MDSPTKKQIDQDLLRPVFKGSPRYFLAVAFFAAIVLTALGAWGYQILAGMGVAGINHPIFWGFYITNFVFWIGLSHAGTLISAILRITHARWRRPVTRCAEVLTVFALSIGALFPLIHLGRVWKFYWLLPYPSERGLWPNFRSPLLWDAMAITTYLLGSVTFLLLPTIPDFALMRDKFPGWKKKVYAVLALGWRGTAQQWHRLETAMNILAVVIIPVAVSVHTVVSWDFAMVPVPMWNTAIFGPYFVCGAIFSGIAALIIVMFFIRKLLHLEHYLQPIHFDNLGKLLLTLSLLWLYFIFAEHLTAWYNNEPSEMAVFWSTIRGRYAPYFWTMVVCNFAIPFPILAIRRLRTVGGTLIASFAVLIGMWLERFLIIVPSLSYKQIPYAWGSYQPSWVEITITAGTFAAIILLYLLFVKVVPIISIWELKGGEEQPARAERAETFAEQAAER
ncbi:MAG: polysulfide reductase NrfD [Acidobacteria bacterium]|nr:polysulfide reductase NrfD [Acidobacteriota bacterium]